MLMRISRANNGGFDIIRTDVHDVGLGVVNPYNGMIVGHGFPFWCVVTPIFILEQVKKIPNALWHGIDEGQLLLSQREVG